MSKTHSIPKSFLYAIRGLSETFRNEPNFRIQLSGAVLAMVTGVILKISFFEWIILIITIFLVLLLELINTTFEAMVDLFSPEISEKAGLAKDASAASVLVSSILALIVGVMIFLPKMLLLLK